MKEGSSKTRTSYSFLPEMMNAFNCVYFFYFDLIDCKFS